MVLVEARVLYRDHRVDQLLRDTANAMDALQKRLPIDRLLGK